MKLPFFVFFCFSSYVVCGQVDDEFLYKKLIYDFVLKYDQEESAVQNMTLIVLERPDYMKEINNGDFDKLKAKYKKLDRQTFLDFAKNSQKELQFKDITILYRDIVILNKESITERRELTLKYPNWNRSIYEFSNIGYNYAKNQALVYYGYDSGPGVGGGIYVIFEKKGKKWKYKKIISAWAS